MNDLDIFDLMHLKLIDEGNAVNVRVLNGLVRTKMRTLDIRYMHRSDLQATQEAIARLRSLGLITQGNVLVAHAANASLLWSRIGRNWHNWPAQVNFREIQGEFIRDPERNPEV